MAREIRFIFVGKIKQNFWKEAEKFYLTRLQRTFSVNLTIIKDAMARASIQDRIKLESIAILNKITHEDYVILLSEEGKLLSSKALAKKMTKWIEDPGKRPCFIVGGAYGLSPGLKKRANFLFSLSPLTFPHEMARIILLEQIYRAHQISINSPYHH